MERDKYNPLNEAEELLVLWMTPIKVPCDAPPHKLVGIPECNCPRATLQRKTMSFLVGRVGIWDLELRSMAENVLKGYGIETIGALTHCSERDLLMMRYFGRVSLADVKKKLAERGLSLKK